jgi:N6-adenosine-specific RNA methylase IME4
VITGIPSSHTGPLIESGLFAGMPKGYASTLLLDPPVGFQTYSLKGQGRSPSKHYACMSADEVIALGPQIAELCAADCAMIVWWPNPHLAKLEPFLSACGFKYSSTAFVWAKLRKTWTDGTRGFTPDDFPSITALAGTRKQVEIAWLGRRGAPKRQARDVGELVFAPRREHSRKPDEVYGLIERLFPGPYVELFARTCRPGWTSWGDQVGTFPSAHIAHSQKSTVATELAAG